MSIDYARGDVICDYCYEPYPDEVELVELANGDWGEDDQTPMSHGWIREFQYGDKHDHICPECQKELEKGHDDA